MVPRALQKWTVRIAITWIAVVVIAVVGLPLVSEWAFDEIDWTAINQPPSTEHWLGTDSVGRDLLIRVVYGARVSLTIAVLATVISFCIGIPWGAVAGLNRGRIDQILMRIVDGLYAIPLILIVILLVMLLGRNIYFLFIGLGLVSWLDVARITRGQALIVSKEAYIEASRAMGAKSWSVVWHHVIPNVKNPALVYTTLMIPGVIIAESFISFLGLGVQEPATSWGVLIADGVANLHGSPWQLAVPGITLTLTLIAINALGDNLRELYIERKTSTS